VQVIRLLTEEDSFLWTEKGKLVDVLYHEAATGFRWAMGYRPQEEDLQFADFATFLERGLLNETQRAEWDAAHVTGEEEATWAWIDALLRRATDSFMDAGDMSESSMIVREDAFTSSPGPAVLGFANYMSLHYAEPEFISKGIGESFSKWEVGAAVEWNEYEKARRGGTLTSGTLPARTLPAAGIVTPYTEQANHATPLRWVMALGGC
jgi:hypothetical protein